MQVIKIKKDYFELHKNNLNLIELDKNKYLYKKKLKYKIKKIFKVVGLILWIPLFIPITFPLCIVSSLCESIKDYFKSLIYESTSFKSYLNNIKEEFNHIFNVILEIEQIK